MSEVERLVTMSIEPSKELSELCRFPYYIEKKFTVEELMKNGIINDNDIVRMEKGEQICKQIPVGK